MDTTPQMTPSDKRKKRRKEKKIAELARDERVQRLLAYYGLSLVEQTTKPLFGPSPFELEIYDDGPALRKMPCSRKVDKCGTVFGKMQGV